MRLLFLTLFLFTLQPLSAQTFDVQELYSFVMSGNDQSVKEFFLKNGLVLIPVDKEKGTQASAMYGPLGPEDWFNKKGEQILFEFKDNADKLAASFDWDAEKKQIENISMIRPRVDSLTFEKQMAALGMINVRRDGQLFAQFVSQDYELVIIREPTALSTDSEILMIVRRDSKMWIRLPPLPKKFNKKKR